MQPELSDRVAQIWMQAVPPLAELLPHLGILSPEEQDRAERFQLQADRCRFWAGRLLLRTLLSHYSGMPPQAIPIQYTATGKPHWAEPSQPIQFNLSHSHGRILIGLMLKRRIGVDLEWIRPVPHWQRIAQRYFSATEQARLADCRAPERDPLFFQLWTQKEALLKGMGIGLAGYTALARDPDWVTLPLALGEGYAAAVAMERLGEEPPTVLLHIDETDAEER
ncbi:MAG: 4'-phosphopantetheinyl transferase superfamily protein [Thermostichus sp. HHBFW_bins_43]